MSKIPLLVSLPGHDPINPPPRIGFDTPPLPRDKPRAGSSSSLEAVHQQVQITRMKYRQKKAVSGRIVPKKNMSTIVAGNALNHPITTMLSRFHESTGRVFFFLYMREDPTKNPARAAERCEK